MANDRSGASEGLVDGVAPDVSLGPGGRGGRGAGTAAPAYAVTTTRARVLKRTIDLLASLPLLVLLVAVAPVLGLAIAATSPGPVIFRQTRIGRGGRPFTMFKFRTMYADAEERLSRDPVLLEAFLTHDFKVPLAQETRLTPVGRVLRRLSLDELPQVVNVIRGEMSLVGPRPIEPAEVRDLYGPAAGPYLACKPGITGRWQVSGRSHVTHAHRAAIDREYAESWSLLGDVAILLRTVPVVVTARGAG